MKRSLDILANLSIIREMDGLISTALKVHEFRDRQGNGVRVGEAVIVSDGKGGLKIIAPPHVAVHPEKPTVPYDKLIVKKR